MKYISVPINIDAMNRLNFDNCIDNDLIELELNNTDYKKLLETGIINQFNNDLEINIDDFEDEEITDRDKLIKARIIIENLLTSKKREILIKLLNQINNAIKYKTGLFFYF